MCIRDRKCSIWGHTEIDWPGTAYRLDSKAVLRHARLLDGGVLSKLPLAWVHFPERRFHGPDLAGAPLSVGGKLRGFSQAIPASLASSSLAPGDIITVSGAKRTADFALRHTDPKRDHRPQRAAGTLLAVRHRHPRRRHPERRHLPARRLHTANSPTYLV